MEAGTTFLRSDADKHLWVVLSDPKADPENVLIVNLTSLDDRKEKVCILSRGDHPWIRHKTCVNFGDSVVTTLAKLLEAKDAGALKTQTPMRPEVLRRIRDGVLDSERIPLDYAQLLIDQGLIEC
jgi:hypothetical protein